MSKLSGVAHNLPYHLGNALNYKISIEGAPAPSGAFIPPIRRPADPARPGYVQEGYCALEYLHALAIKVGAPVLSIDVLACKITPELNEPLNQILPELKDKLLLMLKKNSIPAEQLASCTITLAFDLNATYLSGSLKELIKCECVIKLHDRQKAK